MSGGGGKKQDNSEQVEKQHEYEMEAWAYKNAHAQRMNNHERLGNILKRRQHNLEVAIKDKTAAEGWDYQMEMREFKHNAKVAAYNKSEQMYGAQIGLNQRAAGLAFENARNVTSERQNKLAFDIASSALQYQHKSSELGMQYDTARSNIAIEREGKTLQQQGKRAEAALSSQDLFVKSIQAKGAAIATGQSGRSANKRYQSIVAEAGRAQAVMVDGLTRADSAYNLSMYGLDQSLRQAGSQYALAKDYTDKSYANTQTMQEQSKLSINRAFDQNIKKIEFDQFSANVKADANRLAMPVPGPVLPKPLATPPAIFLDPPLVVNAPEPIPGAVTTTGTQGTGVGTMIGGAVGGALMLSNIATGGLGLPIGLAVGGLADSLFG
jgi:hypothetical protein